MSAPYLERELVFRDGDFPLSVHFWDDHPDYPLHVHEFSLIVVITGGTGVQIVGDNRYRIRPGDVFVLHGNRPHGLDDTTGLSLINVIFDRRLLDVHDLNFQELPGYQQLFEIEPSLRSNGYFNRHFALNVQQLTKVRSLASSIEREQNACRKTLKALDYSQRMSVTPPGHDLIDAGSNIIALGYFMILIGTLSRWYTNEPLKDYHNLYNIGKAISFIERHYHEQIDIEELAKASGMSRRNLFRRFKELTGQSPISYLSDWRLSRAAHMLETTKKSITEVAFDSGFLDSNYFSKQFTRKMGFPPSKYRASNI